jgi:hypothetical protein
MLYSELNNQCCLRGHVRDRDKRYFFIDILRWVKVWQADDYCFMNVEYRVYLSVIYLTSLTGYPSR